MACLPGVPDPPPDRSLKGSWQAEGRARQLWFSQCCPGATLPLRNSKWTPGIFYPDFGNRGVWGRGGSL